MKCNDFLLLLLCLVAACKTTETPSEDTKSNTEEVLSVLAATDSIPSPKEKVFVINNDTISSDVVVRDSSDSVPKKDTSSLVEDDIILTKDTLVVNMEDTIRFDKTAYFTTGKLWVITKKDKLELLEEKESRKIIEDTMTDIQQFFFKPTEPGKYLIELEYKRPFGKSPGKRQIHQKTILVNGKK